MKKTTRKAIALFVSVILLISVLPCQVFATDVITSEQFTDGNYTYIVENGEATIIRGNIQETHIEIPAELDGYPVTTIGEKAFAGLSLSEDERFDYLGTYSEFKTVVIPDSVKYIGDYAFANAYDLKAIILPGSIVEIGKYAFTNHDDANCDYYVLYQGTNSMWRKIDIKGYCFSTVNNFYANLNVRFVTDSNFRYIVAEDETDKAAGVIDCFATGDITIPSEINNYPVLCICNEAFIDNESITEVNIPDTVSSIGNSAFENCPNLKAISFSKNMLFVGDNAFLNCPSLTDIYFDGIEDEWNEINFYEADDPSIDALYTATIHFNEPRIDIVEENVNMNYKDSLALTVNSNSENVTYISSDETVISVDDDGTITAVGKGTATITAMVDGTELADTCEIEVKYSFWQWLIVIVLFGWIWY